MSLSGKVFKLNDGNTIPAIGYGTGTAWFKTNDDQVDKNLVNILNIAIEKGFTHIDGAEIYKTSNEIGKAIEQNDRSKLFITEKFNVGDSSHKNFSPFKSPYESLKHSLEHKLKTDHVDLYLLHSPFVEKSAHGFDLVEAWKYLEKLKEDGLAKSIGVSNFSVDDLKKILDSDYKFKPAVNQIEYSPYLQNQTPGIIEFSQQEGILVEAYGPLGPLSKGKPGPIDSLIEKLSTKYNKAEEQILLKWVLQKNILPLTTSSKESRIIKFLDIFDFELTQDEVDEITKLGKGKTLRQFWNTEYSKYD